MKTGRKPYSGSMLCFTITWCPADDWLSSTGLAGQAGSNKEHTHRDIPPAPKGGLNPGRNQVAGLGKCSTMLITAKWQRKGQAQNTTGKDKEPIIGCKILGALGPLRSGLRGSP